MKLLHHKIEEEKWFSFSKKDQLLNIAAEVSRFYHQQLQENGLNDKAKMAAERGFELIDLTLRDPKWRGGHELYQLRDALAALYVGKADPAIAKFFYTWLINFSENV